MSVEMRAYDNEHGDPVVVLVTTGTYDVSRLVGLYGSGRCEDHDLAQQIRTAVRKHNGGRAALKLLRDHGGPDFTQPDPVDLATAIIDLHTPYYEVAGQTLVHRVPVPRDEAPEGHVCVIGEWEQCNEDEHWIEACRECRWLTEDGDPGYPLWPCPTARLALEVVTPSRTDKQSDAPSMGTSAQQRTVPTTPEQP